MVAMFLHRGNRSVVRYRLLPGFIMLHKNPHPVDDAVSSDGVTISMPMSNRPIIDRRTFIRGAAGVTLAAAGLAVAGCGPSSPSPSDGVEIPSATANIKPEPDGDLTWYTWSEYVPPELVAGFEKQYGVKINQSYFANNAEMLQKMAGGVEYDLITTNSGFITQLVAGKLVQAFDINSLRNWGQVKAYFQKPWWDAQSGDGRYTAPYGYGGTGIFYRTDKIPTVGGWADMWAHPDAAGHIYVLDSMGDSLGMALLKNGFGMNDGDPANLQKAGSDLLALKSSLASVTQNITPPVASGEAWLMEGWATQVYQGITQMKNPELANFFMPPNGPMLACDTLSIGAKAKAPGTALLFIDWMLAPEHNHALGAFTLNRTGAAGGDAAFAEAMKTYPYFNFAEDLVNDRNNWKEYPYGDRLQLWNSQWSRFTA